MPAHLLASYGVKSKGSWAVPGGFRILNAQGQPQPPTTIGEKMNHERGLSEPQQPLGGSYRGT